MAMRRLETRKDKIKLIRSIVEGLILLLLILSMIRAIFVFTTYQPYNPKDSSIVTGKDQGFIAISYLGVDRTGTNTLIATEALEKQLNALYKNGYVTITQKDIQNYYKNGVALPEKALFLMYEDGRRDTAIFAQKIMENFNYKATVLTYAEKFNNHDTKFLLPEDLKNLLKNSYWEQGSNGYRLEYINVFDRYDNYLGELTSLEYSRVNRYLERKYNQYLMDFIRDKNGIPKETYDEMKSRIEYDYMQMEKIYSEEVGEIPAAYVLMHANTGSYANNDKVSNINESCIKSLFQMNFNREGSVLNTTENDIYDLTRLQPQAYWSTNHLLMRIQDEQKLPVIFEEGNKTWSQRFTELEGEAEFFDDSLILTSRPQGNGLLKVNGSNQAEDIIFSARLKGNKYGTQSVLIRADEEQKNYISVTLKNNVLYIYECINGSEHILFEQNLDLFDGITYQSVEENEKEGLKNISEAAKKYGNEEVPTTAERIDLEKTAATISANSVLTGGKAYVPTIQINEPGDRMLKIQLVSNKLSINLDQKPVVTDMEVDVSNSGTVLLESAWGEYGYSQRNIKDNVYDGVFEGVVLKTKEKGKAWNTVLDYNLYGWDKWKVQAIEIKDQVINWFIKNL